MANRTIALLSFCVLIAISRHDLAADTLPKGNTIEAAGEASIVAAPNGTSSRRETATQLEHPASVGVTAPATIVYKQDSSAASASAVQALPRQTVRSLARRLLAGLVGVAALSAAIVFVGRQQTAKPRLGPSTPLELISTLRIGPRCSLTLVNVHGQAFLVARDAAGLKDIVPVPRSFDSFVLDGLGETPLPVPESEDQPS